MKMVFGDFWRFLSLTDIITVSTKEAKVKFIAWLKLLKKMRSKSISSKKIKQIHTSTTNWSLVKNYEHALENSAGKFSYPQILQWNYTCSSHHFQESTQNGLKIKLWNYKNRKRGWHCCIPGCCSLLYWFSFQVPFVQLSIQFPANAKDVLPPTGETRLESQALALP